MELKQIRINEENYLLNMEKATELGLLIKLNVLPKTWEEFCKRDFKKGECYIDISGRIEEVMPGETRYSSCDKNIMPNKQTAEAMLALCQLIQLRDCYNDDWKPDWNNDKEYKYIIYYNNNYIATDSYKTMQHILAFKTKELRNKFLENFKDLIEIAKPLI